MKLKDLLYYIKIIENDWHIRYNYGIVRYISIILNPINYDEINIDHFIFMSSNVSIHKDQLSKSLLDEEVRLIFEYDDDKMLAKTIKILTEEERIIKDILE